MKIVVLDGYTLNPGDLSWAGLEALGALTVYDRTSLTDESETIARIGDAEIVYTNKTPLSKRFWRPARASSSSACSRRATTSSMSPPRRRRAF